MDLLEKVKQSKKKEVWKNPMGETWEIEYTAHDTCMLCSKERYLVSKYNGTCAICDNRITEKEYMKFIKNRKESSGDKDKSNWLKSNPDTPDLERKKHMDDLFTETKKKVKEADGIYVYDDPLEKVDDVVFVYHEDDKEEKTDFSFDEYPIIALVWGYDGTSKSEQIMKFEPKEKTLIFDLEDKLRPLAAKLNFPQENIINAKKYNAKYDVSGPATLQGIRNIIKEIKKCKRENKGRFKDLEAVAFDGISDIRKPFAVLEWLKEHPDRKKPMNWGDWGEINDKVKDICFSLINMGLVTNTSIFFTAQIDWKADKEVPDCKPWIWHNIQHKFKMTRDDANKRFYAYCEKSHHDPFWTIDLTDWTRKEKPSLFNILQDPKLVKKYSEAFVVEQDELAEKKLDGEVFE